MCNWLSDRFICPGVLTAKPCACQKPSDWWQISTDLFNTELSKKMDGIWNRYNLKSTGRIYTFGVLKYSEKFKVLDLL